MDIIGFLFEMFLYFAVIAGLVAAVIGYVDDKVALPSASPWRMRSPKLCVAAAPVLFAVAMGTSLTGSPGAVPGALTIASIAAPWVGAAMIAVEWARRRAEDNATGLIRPLRTSARARLRKST